MKIKKKQAMNKMDRIEYRNQNPIMVDNRIDSCGLALSSGKTNLFLWYITLAVEMIKDGSFLPFPIFFNNDIKAYTFIYLNIFC